MRVAESQRELSPRRGLELLPAHKGFFLPLVIKTADIDFLSPRHRRMLEFTNSNRSIRVGINITLHAYMGYIYIKVQDCSRYD